MVSEILAGGKLQKNAKKRIQNYNINIFDQNDVELIFMLKLT